MRDRELLSQICSEVVASALSSPTSTMPHIDVNKLSLQPLIQSCYAEILRLRTYNLLVTTSEHSDFHFRDWIIPKDTMVAVSSHTAHMDVRFWNTGSVDAPHNLNSFWAERFLHHTSDPHSGPLKSNHSAQPNSRPSQTRRNHHPDEVHQDSQPTADGTASSGFPWFSLAGLSGIWAPFGGGYSLCPGRHLAKAEIMLSVAVFSLAFEFDFAGDSMRPESGSGNPSRKKEDFQLDLRYFGMGVLPPKHELKVKVRRRTRGNGASS